MTRTQKQNDIAFTFFQWIILCKWQLIFDRCVLKRDLNSIDDVIQPISVLDKYDASFKYEPRCLAIILHSLSYFICKLLLCIV